MKKIIYLIALFLLLNLNAADESKMEKSAYSILHKELSVEDFENAIKNQSTAGIEKSIKEGACLIGSFFNWELALGRKLMPIFNPNITITNPNAEQNKQIVKDIAEKIAIMLKQYGADVNDSSRVYTLPLINAIEYDNLTAVNILINLGANVNLRNEGSYPINSLRTNGKSLNSVKILKLLIKAGADINKKDYEYGSLLMKAAEDLKHLKYCPVKYCPERQLIIEKIIIILLMNGADLILINSRTRFSPEENSKFFDYLDNWQVKEVVKKFINYVLRANINKIKGAENALMLAAALGEPNLVNALLRKGILLKPKNQIYFNFLIKNQPATLEFVNQYKLEREYLDNLELLQQKNQLNPNSEIFSGTF